VGDDAWIVNCIGRVVNGGHTFVRRDIRSQRVMQGGEYRIEAAGKLTMPAMLIAER
jgi:hypothetical protein